MTSAEIKAIQKSGIDWYGNPLKVDGIIGPKTLWWSGIKSLSQQRQDVISLALGYHATGMGEATGKNDGTFVDMLLGPVKLRNMSWCVAFVAHCMKKSGVSIPVYFTGAEQLIKAVSSPRCTYAKFVDEPIPCDVEVYLYPRKAGDTYSQGHARLVTGYDPATKITAGVDGNVTNCVRTGLRHDRPERKFVRFNALGEQHGDLVMPVNMMKLDNLGDR